MKDWDDDADFAVDEDWVAATSGAKPLHEKHKNTVKHAPKVSLKPTRKQSDDYVVESLAGGASLTLEGADIPTGQPSLAIEPTKAPFTYKEFTPQLMRATRTGVEPKTLQKLAKGEIPYEQRIDLHGFKEEEAWGGCLDFLRNAYHGELRCVLIIHGKGKGYGINGEMGIIKSQMPSWLESSQAVLAYHTAQPKHGGAGAVYVLIRKKK